jgi:hypothetical protein
MGASSIHVHFRHSLPPRQGRCRCAAFAGPLAPEPGDAHDLAGIAGETRWRRLPGSAGLHSTVVVTRMARHRPPYRRAVGAAGLEAPVGARQIAGRRPRSPGPSLLVGAGVTTAAAASPLPRPPLPGWERRGGFTPAVRPGAWQAATRLAGDHESRRQPLPLAPAWERGPGGRGAPRICLRRVVGGSSTIRTGQRTAGDFAGDADGLGGSGVQCMVVIKGVRR